mgnify:CR=1 FL=1
MLPDSGINTAISFCRLVSRSITRHLSFFYSVHPGGLLWPNSRVKLFKKRFNDAHLPRTFARNYIPKEFIVTNEAFHYTRKGEREKKNRELRVLMVTKVERERNVMILTGRRELRALRIAIFLQFRMQIARCRVHFNFGGTTAEKGEDCVLHSVLQFSPVYVLSFLSLSLSLCFPFFVKGCTPDIAD